MRLALIDGSNLHESVKAARFFIDYKKLREFLNEDGELLRAYYFTALRPKEIHSQVRKTVDWLSHNEYICITKETKEFIDPFTKEMKVKGNVDVEIVTYAFVHASKVSEIWLFSGDGDFTEMVKQLQLNYALKVYVVSTLGLVATELRRQADKFINLADIREDIEMEVLS